MKRNLKMTLLGLPLLAALPLVANADEPGRHPAYVHAMSDLRAARWLVEHRGGGDWMQQQEDMAIHEIDGAMADVHHAAVFEDKDIFDQPHADIPDNQGRLHQAQIVLRRAHDDLAATEDDPRVRGLRDHAIQHVDNAYQILDQAIREARH